MTTTPLPPPGRHFDVYQAVIVEGVTTREAARRFQLSQTRVCQLVQSVSAFIAEVIPKMAKEVSEEQRLTMSKQIASLRLEQAYQSLIAAWNDSKGEAWRIRECPLKRVPVTTRYSTSGNAAYLMAAMRVSERQLELPLPILLRALAREEDEEAAKAEPAEEERPVELDLVELKKKQTILRQALAEMKAGLEQMQQQGAGQASTLGRTSEEACAASGNPTVEGCSGNGQIEPVADEEQLNRLPQAAAGEGLAAQPPFCQSAPEIVESALFKRRLARLDLPPEGQPLNRKQRRARERAARRLLAAG